MKKREMVPVTERTIFIVDIEEMVPVTEMTIFNVETMESVPVTKNITVMRHFYLEWIFYKDRGVIDLVRNARLWFEGAKYHVTSRGNRKSLLFLEEEDYEKYLDIIAETRTRYPFHLHTFCLMTNHTHLQLETLEIPLSNIMKNLNTKYAKYFNKKYEFTGHVFEKRYGAELLNSREYEIDVSKYIHLNPLEAGMVAAPEDYLWSSYRTYVNGEVHPLIDSKPILSYFPDPPTLYYQQYMNASATDKFFWEDGKLLKRDGEWFRCGLE